MHCHSSDTFRRMAILASAALVLLVLPPSLEAQGKPVAPAAATPMPDSAQQAAMFMIARRMQSPAAGALEMKQELGLSPEQVAAIEALARAEADSLRARTSRLMEIAQQNAQKNPSLATGMGWTDPIDEAAIRAATCEQARGQAEMVIGLLRDRHALGVLLTTNQQHQYDELQAAMMMRAMQLHK